MVSYSHINLLAAFSSERGKIDKNADRTPTCHGLHNADIFKQARQRATCIVSVTTWQIRVTSGCSGQATNDPEFAIGVGGACHFKQDAAPCQKTTAVFSKA
jgi:hypothetical protein